MFLSSVKRKSNLSMKAIFLAFLFGLLIGLFSSCSYLSFPESIEEGSITIERLY